MNIRLQLLVSLLLFSTLISAQSGSCDSERYLKPLFDGATVTRDLQYGQGVTMGGNTQDLLMDIWEPAGDTVRKRPVIVLAHGGAFIAGDRTQTEELCVEFAKCGYVVANMAYRLMESLPADSVGMTEGVILAINDMRAAVRFVRDNACTANCFGIDTSYIFAAGLSAGAVMASHLGFLDQDEDIPDYLQVHIDKHGGFEGNSSDNTHISSEVHAVLNYSGALLRSSWIDGGDVPLFSAHDEMDPIVPFNYNKSSILPFPVYLYGSGAMREAAKQAGIPNQLYLVPNSGGHVSYFSDDERKPEVFAKSTAFLKSIMCKTVDVQESPELEDAMISVYPNPFTEFLNIDAVENIREISVISITGRVMIRIRNPEYSRINLSGLNSGIYFLDISTQHGRKVLKVIKQ